MTVKLAFALLITASLAFSAPALAGQRAGHGGAVGRAVPRAAAPRVVRPTIVAPRVIRPYGYGYPYYGSYRYPYRFSLGFYAGYPFAYGYPYGYYPYPYGYAYPGYGVAGDVGAYGGVRIEGAPRDAQVYADGYYAGIVDDFDGTFQHLDLPAGPHRIEIRAPGFPPTSFDVRVEPGRTITYHAELPRQ
jgi:hypothetical protein